MDRRRSHDVQLLTRLVRHPAPTAEPNGSTGPCRPDRGAPGPVGTGTATQRAFGQTLARSSATTLRVTGTSTSCRSAARSTAPPIASSSVERPAAASRCLEEVTAAGTACVKAHTLPASSWRRRPGRPGRPPGRARAARPRDGPARPRARRPRTLSAAPPAQKSTSCPTAGHIPHVLPADTFRLPRRSLCQPVGVQWCGVLGRTMVTTSRQAPSGSRQETLTAWSPTMMATSRR